MDDRHAFPLDGVDAERDGVEQHIDQVVRQEVHLVDVQDTAMSRRQQSGLKSPASLAQGPLEIEGSQYPIFCCSQGQIDE